ncbi:CotS family spore coat protein [Anaerobacillus sp. MEB173]|uniref:CotS family spore coat protein n=1 Tax=Anaerobacillus sp. MEB173 TaxID=3383345 RepID=UPI003F92616D
MNGANKVLLNYPITIKTMSLLSDKGKKAVWLIKTDSGEFILKKVPMQKERLNFMAHAIGFLRKNGVLTPEVMYTNSNEPYVLFNGEYYILFEAITGRKPNYKKGKELASIMRGLANFHKASTGIEIPVNSKPSYLLGTWKEEYEKRYQQLIKWKNLCSTYRKKSKFDSLFLLHVDQFLNQCRKSLQMLKDSCYDDWVELTTTNHNVCHQDFAAGNLALDRNNNLHVFDMDSLTIDLPVRDIRKILNKVMKKQTKWDLKLLKKMLHEYETVFPLTKDQHTVLVAGLLFPHLFYGQVSKYFENRETGSTEEKRLQRLKEMIATETSKEQVLNSYQSSP